MAEQRLKGQEVQISVIKDGTVLTAFNSIGTFSDVMKLEKKEDGFLGEGTNRYDAIFNGYDGTFEISLSNQEWMEFQQVLKDKAQRNTPAVEINISRTDFYPNGDTPTRVYKDCEFGAQPTSVAARGEFVKINFDFSCSDVEDLTDPLP